MSRVTLNDIVSYLETQLNTLSNIDTVKYTNNDSQPIPVKTYGCHIFFNEGDLFEQEFKHIGRLSTEYWRINVNVIINRRLNDRESLSDSLGVSYWIDTVRGLLQNKTNDGAFKNSWWEYRSEDPKDDSYTLNGVFVCEILNNFN